MRIKTTLAGRISGAAAAIALVLSFGACSKTEQHGSKMFDPAAYKLTWAENDVWQDAYQDVPLYLEPFNFSHTAYHTDAGMEFYGFCPSRLVDQTPYEDWTGHEMSVMARSMGGVFLVSHWNSREPMDAIPSSPSVMFKMQDNSQFTLTDIYFANTTYGYYTMSGRGAADGGISGNQWCRINVIGVRYGAEVCRQEVYLAKNNEVLGNPTVSMNSLGENGWSKANFEKFEDLDYVYMQMEASTTQDGVMLVPPYFVIGSILYNN